jgi:hypothetical protein
VDSEPSNNSANVNLEQATKNGEARGNLYAPSHSASWIDESDFGIIRPLQRVVGRQLWEIRYARAVAAADVLGMVISLGLHKWWGQAPDYAHLRVWFGLIVMVLTVAALRLAHAWDPSVLGQGSKVNIQPFRGSDSRLLPRPVGGS